MKSPRQQPVGGIPSAIAWVGWLVLFLVFEVYAAFSKEDDDTLSENVWIWFDRTWERVVLGAFMLSLTSHFVFETTVLPIIVLGGIMTFIIGRDLGR
jgi:hypothetical protein